MMEFFLSKVWAFAVAIVLMGVLVQGVSWQAQAERSSALQDMAENIQELFRSMQEAGPGLDQTIEMGRILTGRTNLTVYQGYMVLATAAEKIRFEVPVENIFAKMTDGTCIKVSSMLLQPNDLLRAMTGSSGLDLTVLGPRSSQPNI